MQRVLRKDEHSKATWCIALILIFLLTAFLMGEAIIRATDDPMTAKLRLLQAMLLSLFVAPLAAQLLDQRKYLPRGPRQFVEQLRTPVNLLALLIATRQPETTVSVGDALRDWALFLVIISLVNGYDLVSRLIDLRHKRRALLIIGRNVAQIVVLAGVLCCGAFLVYDQTAAQRLWAGIIILAVLVSDSYLWRIRVAARQDRIGHGARHHGDG
jgi:hypothetical protein